MATYTWNGGNGDWSDAADWTPNGVPGLGDTANIGNIGLSAAITVTASASGLSNAGTINLTGNLSSAKLATLDDTGAAPTTLGNINILGDALLEFGSGAATNLASGTTFSLRDDVTPISLNAGSNTTGTFTNSGTLEVDWSAGNSDGGSSLSIGNTLANSGVVTIGNTNLGAATTVTASGLSNAGTINLTGNLSSAKLATLDITGSASDSGTLDINANTAVNLTGLTGVFTQAAGETVVASGGALSAPTIAVTGGTLEGTGALTGVVSNSGGVVAGGSVDNSSPGVMTLTGTYQSSGTGTLIALLSGTGAGQVGALDVTGSLNLQGGALQAKAVGDLSFASGQVFSNVLTFTSGDFQGLFSELEAGGQTGNGVTINLGGNLTLGALYNVAAGNVTLEVVATPITTADVWTTGVTGNWDTLADWSVRVPTFYSDVTIGGANSNVTLSQDATIDSLTLSSGGTLSASGWSLTVGGAVNVQAGATFTGTNLNVGGSFTDGGGVTISAGTLDLLAAATIGGAIGGTGVLVFAGGSAALNSGATITIASLTISGAGTNVSVNEALSYGGTFTEGAGSTVTVGGGDALTLSGNSTFAGSIGGAGALAIAGGSDALNSGATITTASLTISGAATSVSVNEALGYGGSFTDGAGSTVTIGGGDSLTLGGNSMIAGSIGGAGALAFAGGSAALDSGATITTANLSESGAGTLLTLAENLSYGGAFTEGAGSTLSISSGDTLTLTGTSNIGGTVSGAGTLALAGGGSTTIESGANLSVAKWSISGAGTTVTLDEAVTYAGSFSEGAGATLTGGPGTPLTLTGSANFTGGTLNGAHEINTKGTTAVSGLTIGGTAIWYNYKTVTQSGGNVTVGDGTGATAVLSNTSTGTYDITDDSGIGRGTSTASHIANAGLFEKTGGTGTSVVTPSINNTGTIEVSSGMLDLQGAVTGTGTDTIQNASTLEFDSTLAAGQTVNFSPTFGTLDLIDPLGYGGSQIGDFVKGDNVDLNGAWSLLSFGENAGHTLGTLTLAQGANHVALEFAGNFTQSSFSINTGATTIIAHA